MPIFSAILSAAVPALVGGLLNRRKQPKPLPTPEEEAKTVTHEVDYEKLRANAEAAGFNPLTALRSGGSAGFTKTHTPVLSMAAVEAARYSEPDPWVGALQSGIQAAFDYDPLNQERAKLETDIMRAQLARLNMTNEQYTRLGNQPSALGQATIPAPGDRTVTNPYPYGTVHTGLVDAEAAEARYGDVVQELFGGINFFGDINHRSKSHPVVRRYNEAFKPVRELGTSFADYISGRNRPNPTVRGRGAPYIGSIPSFFRF